MISLKNIITESIFDSLMDKWSMIDDKDEVEKYIDRFKILKNRNFITGKDSDISLWFNKSFQEFKKYIDEKDKSFQQIVSIKRSGQDVEKYLKMINVSLLYLTLGKLLVNMEQIPNGVSPVMLKIIGKVIHPEE